MAQAKTRSSSGSTSPKTQRKSASGGASRSSNGSSKSRNGTSRSTSKSSSSRPKSSASRTKSNASRTKSSASRAQANGAADSKAATTLLAAAGTAAGLVGGAMLGSKFAKKPKRVLGVKVPGTGGGIDGLAKQVGKAGKQFNKASKQLGQLTGEVRAAREKAEQVGKVIS